MKMKKVLRVLLVTLAALALGTVGMLSASAAAETCPPMPKGARNYITDATETKLLGNDPYIWEKGSLIVSMTESSNYMEFAFPSEITVQDAYVISFWTHMASRDANSSLRVRFLGTHEGQNESLYLYPNAARVCMNNQSSAGTAWLDPETQSCLRPESDLSLQGVWNKVELYITPSAEAGAVTLRIYLNGHRMVRNSDASVDAVDLDASVGLSLGFGCQGENALVRGLRLYKAEPSATEFEPDVDPVAELTGAEPGLTPDQLAAATQNGGQATTPGQSSADSESLLPVILLIAVIVVVGAGILVLFIMVRKKKAAPAPEITAETAPEQKGESNHD